VANAIIATRRHYTSPDTLTITPTTNGTGNSTDATTHTTTTSSTNPTTPNSVRGSNNAKNTNSNRGTSHPNATTGTGLQSGELRQSGMVTGLHPHNPSTDQGIRTVTATGPTYKPIFHPKSNASTSHTDTKFGRLSTTVDRTSIVNGGTTGTTSDSGERHRRHQQSPSPLSQGCSSSSSGIDDKQVDENKWKRISKHGWRYGSMGFYECQECGLLVATHKRIFHKCYDDGKRCLRKFTAFDEEGTPDDYYEELLARGVLQMGSI
jgi:hypothetical protein